MENTKICFITAIYGNYEASCKKFAKQSVDATFICFTDNPNIINNGWIIDTTPYHLLCKSNLDNDTYINSLSNNYHTFNIAKYYKQQFTNIPRLAEYDIIVWLDGTIEIISSDVGKYLQYAMILNNESIVGWHHEERNGQLEEEVKASHFERYTSTYWNGQSQPYQDIDNQYNEYINDGYTNSFFKNMGPRGPCFGVWITCFVAFQIKKPSVKEFLDLWYLQTLKYTTQDQIGFPYVCYKTNLIPHTLPNNIVSGHFPGRYTSFYIKHNHGK